METLRILRIEHRTVFGYATLTRRDRQRLDQSDPHRAVLLTMMDQETFLSLILEKSREEKQSREIVGQDHFIHIIS